jgi:hypothetical protein
MAEAKRYAVTIVRTITDVVYVEEPNIKTIQEARQQIEDYGLIEAVSDYTDQTHVSYVTAIKSVKLEK